MSFHEKSAWACIGSILLSFVPYFLVVFRHPMGHIGLFIIAVVGLVVLLAGFHGAISLATASIRKTGDVPELDELDQTIEMRAAKASGAVLATVVLFWSIGAMFGMPALGVAEIVKEKVADELVSSSDFAIPVTKVMLWIHILFAGFVLANLTYYASIVAGYRRLAHG